MKTNISLKKQQQDNNFRLFETKHGCFHGQYFLCN